MYIFINGSKFFGWAISAHKAEAWIGPVMFFGILNFGIIVCCVDYETQIIFSDAQTDWMQCGH